MPDIAFACSKCDQNLEAPGEMAGNSVECPSCGAEIVIPEPAPAQNPADILTTAQAQTEQAVEPEAEAPAAPQEPNVCPGCKAEMEPDAVLCLQCGFHKGLGKKISTELS